MPVINETRFKILVVDDNLKNIQVLGAILKDANYIVGFATDGQQAINLLKRKNDYDLILLDVNMPVMNGYDTCVLIRQDPALNEIPVIFITAFGEVDSIVKGFEAGAQDYLTKPFNSKELLVRVNTHLQLKKRTDQVKSMNQMLELKVAERTAELVSANKKLELLDKTKSDLLILLSHELRTPLTGIMGFAQLLMDTVEDPEQKKFVEYLLDSADRLLNFSETALLVTSLKIKTYRFDFKTQNLATLIENVVKNFQPQLFQKSILVKQHITNEDIYVSADMDLISIAFKNVFDNAIKASPNGGQINITVGKDENNVTIKIKDDGKGFSKEALTNLFELFSTTDVMHHFEGLGLGLASVKMIMDVHGGRVEAINTLNGAEVTMMAPLINKI